MKIVIPGGSGHIGTMLSRALRERGHEVVVLSRAASTPADRRWDGRTLGPWSAHIESADVVINLAGRSVDCRYNKTNLEQMLSSRTDSTEVIGRAIAQAARPPRVWLQMSTATIYAHRYDADNEERSGVIGGHEPDAPSYWRFSVEIAKAWERTLWAANTPRTRKVALRSAMVMCLEKGSVFDILRRLARLRLGGAIAGGAQYVSWIHEHDFVRAIELLIARDDIDGVVNLAAPAPLPQRAFMRALRRAVGVRWGLGGTRWMIELATVVHRTDSELLLKSRRVVSSRLREAGFTFEYPSWPEAADELVARRRALRAAARGRQALSAADA
ncbi:MAG: DUF1731 domain-containing protein [Myxococcales bacterium]|nr:DUF1731 domain-containing protein [Myxococcales bacterium]